MLVGGLHEPKSQGTQISNPNLKGIKMAYRYFGTKCKRMFSFSYPQLFKAAHSVALQR